MHWFFRLRALVYGCSAWVTSLKMDGDILSQLVSGQGYTLHMRKPYIWGNETHQTQHRTNSQYIGRCVYNFLLDGFRVVTVLIFILWAYLMQGAAESSARALGVSQNSAKRKYSNSHPKRKNMTRWPHTITFYGSVWLKCLTLRTTKAHMDGHHVCLDPCSYVDRGCGEEHVATLDQYSYKSLKTNRLDRDDPYLFQC